MAREGANGGLTYRVQGRIRIHERGRAKTRTPRNKIIEFTVTKSLGLDNYNL